MTNYQIGNIMDREIVKVGFLPPSERDAEVFDRQLYVPFAYNLRKLHSNELNSRKRGGVGSMKKIETYASQHPCIISLFAMIICFAALRLCVPNFIYIDDSTISNAVNGTYSGTPSDFAPFAGIFLTRGLSFLYGLLPSVEWYSVFMEAAVFFSCTAINYAILICANKQNLPLWVSTVIFGILFAAGLFVISASISFTMVAGLCGAAASALLIAASEKEEHTVLPAALSGVLLLAAELIRHSCFLFAVCFYLLAAARLAAKAYSRASADEDDHSGRAVVAVICGLALIVTVCLVSAADKSSLAGEPENESWNEYRSALIDYEIPDYEDMPQVYEAAGWNKESYALAKAWYFADSSFDIDTLKSVGNAVQRNTEKGSLFGSVLTVGSVVIGSLTSQTQIVFTLLLLLTIGFVILCIIKKTFSVGDIVFAVCALGGAVIMWLYLAIIGRLLYRLYLLTALQAIVLLLLLIARNFPFAHFCQKVSPKTAWFVVLCCFCGLLGIYAGAFRITSRTVRLLALLGCIGLPSLVFLAVLLFHRKNISFPGILLCCAVFAVSFLPATVGTYTKGCDFAFYREVQEKEDAVLAYVAQNSETVYLRAPHCSYRTVSWRSSEYGQKNLFCTLDYMSYTRAYTKKLAENGLEEMTASSLLEDEVYFIGDAENDKLLPLLLDFLQARYGESVSAERYAEIDGLSAVYRFTR